VNIVINPQITPEELLEFYKKNDICEKGFDASIIVKPLNESSIIIAAYDVDRLVGITRAMFDGITAVIMEFCLDVEFQGNGLKLDNGSMMEKDNKSVGKQMGEILVEELHKMGAYFISATVCENLEKDFYESIGFIRNEGHVNYVIDTRPYVNN